MNIEDYEQLETPSIAINMTAGALAGILEHCIMYPMDSVKIALPAPQAPAPAAAAPDAGPFTTAFQAAGALAGAGFADLARFAGIFPTTADSALGVGQTVFTRFFTGINAFAGGK